MTKKLDFSNRYCIREIEHIIRDRSKKIVYNKKGKFFEAISVKDSLSCDQTDNKIILKEKIRELAGIIHLRLEDINIILRAVRDRINKEKKKRFWFFRNYLKNCDFISKNSLEIYQFFEEVLNQIIQQSTNKVLKSKDLFLENKTLILSNKFLKLKDFEYPLNSCVKYLSEKEELEVNTKKTKIVFNNVASIHILNNISEELYLLSRDDILIYENFRKNLLNENFPKKPVFLELEHVDIFEYSPSIEELSTDITTFLKENFCDFSFILKLLLKIFLRKSKEELTLLSNKLNSAKMQWFLHKMQLISQNEDTIFFNMIAILLSPIKKVLEKPSVLKQEKIKQNLQEEIVSLKNRIISLKALSYFHWEICILNLFEEWIFDNKELLKLSLTSSLKEKKKENFFCFLKGFFRK